MLGHRQPKFKTNANTGRRETMERSRARPPPQQRTHKAQQLLNMHEIEYLCCLSAYVGAQSNLVQNRTVFFCVHTHTHTVGMQWPARHCRMNSLAENSQRCFRNFENNQCGFVTAFLLLLLPLLLRYAKCSMVRNAYVFGRQIVSAPVRQYSTKYVHESMRYEIIGVIGV